MFYIFNQLPSNPLPRLFPILIEDFENPVKRPLPPMCALNRFRF